MVQASISYFSEPASSLQTLQSDLLIYIGDSILTYAIVQNKEIIAFEKYDFDSSNISLLNHFYEDKNWLHQKYRKVNIAYATHQCTLVPLNVIKENNDTILDTMYGDQAIYKSFEDTCSKHQLKVIYRIRKELVRFVIGKYPLASTSHFQSIVLNEYSNFDGVKILLHCMDDYYVITFLQQNKILLAKTYEIASNEKLAYQLLAICKMFNIEASAVKLEISGWVSKSSTLYNELYRFFEQISFDDTLQNLSILNKEYDMHFFKIFDLINQLQ